MTMNTLESFRHEERIGKTKRHTTRRTESLVISEFDPNNPPPLTQEQKERIETLSRMPDSEIDYSDIPRQKPEEWNNNLIIGNPYVTPPTKSMLKKLMIDSDIIFWILRQVGESGYQDKINAILRQAMETEQDKGKQATEQV